MLLTLRMAWCREQKALASTEPELDGWCAEEDGLRDALLNRDHTDHYRLSPPEIFDRYVQGFQDGTAMLRAAQAERLIHSSILLAPGQTKDLPESSLPLHGDRA